MQTAVLNKNKLRINYPSYQARSITDEMISTLFMVAAGREEYVHLQNYLTFLFFQASQVTNMATRTAGITPTFFHIPVRDKLVI
jgi:hypothetical protein